MKILPFGDDVGLLETAGPLFTSEIGQETISVTLKNAQGKYMLASIEGVSDRTVAENIKGQELWISRSILPELSDEDGYYIEDLIGLNVVDNNAETLGSVKAVHNFGATDLIEVDFKDGKNAMIPFTDMYVPAVRLANKEIEISEFEEFLS